MPCFLMFTNLQKEKLPNGFLLELSQAAAKAIRKDEKWVTVRVHTDQMMSHAGTEELCANSELQSIGNLGKEDNQRISKEISEFLQQKIGLDPKRNYIKFTDMSRMEVGWNSTTFAFM